MTQFLFAAVAAVGFLLSGQTATPQHTAIDGKWHFVLDTPGGDREMDAEFAADADGKVTGKFGKTDVAGTFKDGHLALEFSMTAEESGETATMKIDGKVDDAMALAGTWAFSSYDGTFKASHPKPQT
ncbi:MAG: hypothetical protein ABSF53_06280 [Terracidiphilus sp.]